MTGIAVGHHSGEHLAGPDPFPLGECREGTDHLAELCAEVLEHVPHGGGIADEDLGPQLRVAGRVLFNRYWSIFGAAVIDLTDRNEDPLSVGDGWEQVRDRLGIQYEDDCLQIGFTWKRDYERIGAFRAGNRFGIHLALKGIGR